MAVTILMGKAGNGKSSQCFNELQAWEAAGGKAMLLVPDQATYGAERRLAEHAKGRGFVGTQVVGFSRLAWPIMCSKSRDFLMPRCRNWPGRLFYSACSIRAKRIFPCCRRQPDSRILPIRLAGF